MSKIEKKEMKKKKHANFLLRFFGLMIGDRGHFVHRVHDILDKRDASRDEFHVGVLEHCGQHRRAARLGAVEGAHNVGRVEDERIGASGV